MRFSEELWDKFDDVCKRVENGKEFTSTFSKFLKKRADIEKDYARNMAKLCKDKSFLGEMEIGTLKQAWVVHKEEVENMAQKHAALAEQLALMVQAITTYLQNARKTRKTLVSNGSKVISELKKAESNETKAKFNHENLRKKQDEAEEEAQRNNGTPKQDKSLKAAASALKRAESADNEYKDAVRLLQEAQRKFHQDVMPKILDDLQSLEETRVDTMRDWLVSGAEAQEVLPPSLQQSVDAMKNSALGVNKIQDIELFITNTQSGVEKPPEVSYVPYIGRSGSVSIASGSGSGSSSYNSGASLNGASYNGVSSASFRKSTVTASASSFTPVGSSSNNSSSSRIASISPLAAKPLCMSRALYDYKGTEDNELTFNANEMISVLQKDGSGWWKGELNGRIGMFPSNFVELVEMNDYLSSAPDTPQASAPQNNNLQKCKALYDYNAESENELTIREGDILTVESEDEGWLFGRNEKGESGRYPSTYVQML